MHYMYESLSKYPAIKRSITIVSSKPYEDIEYAVSLPHWHTVMRRTYRLTDRYNDTWTFDLQADRLDTQLPVRDMDFWIFQIDSFLKQQHLGEIQDYIPDFELELHVDVPAR